MLRDWDCPRPLSGAPDLYSGPLQSSLSCPSHRHPLPSSCVHGKLSCSLDNCSQAGGGLSPWGPWGPCSHSCGGLGTRTRSRQCVRPTPVPGGQGCVGTLQDLEYCPSPDCPGKGGRMVVAVSPGSACPVPCCVFHPWGHLWVFLSLPSSRPLFQYTRPALPVSQPGAPH